MIKKIMLFTAVFCALASNAYPGGESRDIAYEDKQYGFSIAYPSNFQTVKNHQGARIVILLPQKLSKGFYRDNIVVSVNSIQLAGRTADEIIDIYFKYDGTVLDRNEITINGTRFFSIVQTHTRSFWFFRLNLKIHHLITERGAMLYTISYSALIDNYDKNIAKAKQIMHTFKFTG